MAFVRFHWESSWQPHVGFAVGDTALARAGSSVRLGAISTREHLRYLGSLFQAKDAVIGQPRLFLMGDRHIALTFAFPSFCRAQKRITYAPSPYILFPGYANTHCLPKRSTSSLFPKWFKQVLEAMENNTGFWRPDPEIPFLLFSLHRETKQRCLLFGSEASILYIIMSSPLSLSVWNEYSLFVSVDFTC